MMLEEFLRHSAKGSTWKEHKYIKKIDGAYYYPDSYEGGRHLSDKEKETSGGGAGEEREEETSEKKTWEWGAEDLTDENIEELARLVIRGEFGNGQTRKDLLGEEYQRIQNRVNEILLGDAYKSEAVAGKKKAEEIVEKESNTPLSKAVEATLSTRGKTLSDIVKQASQAAMKSGSGIQSGKPRAERVNRNPNKVTSEDLDEKLEKQRKKR